MEASSLRNRLVMATAMWREASDEPLPKLSQGDPADQIAELELRVVDLLCAEASTLTARETATKTWDMVHDRADDDPVKQRVVECHERLAKLAAESPPEE